MLSLTLIGPAGIVLAKLLSTTGVFLLIIVGTAPLLCAVFFMVGIDIVQLFIGYYMVILTTLTCASLGILSSAYTQSTTRAISRSYMLMAMNMGLGYVLVMLGYVLFFFAKDGVNGINTLNQNSWFTPEYSTLPMMFAVIGGMMTPNASLNQYLVNHTIMQSIIIVVSLFLTWRKIRRPVKPPVAKKRAMTKANQATAGEALALPPGFKPIPNRMNPMTFRETHWGIDIKKRTYIGMILVMLALSSGLAYGQSEIGMQGTFATIFLTNLAIFSLFLLSNFSNIFTKEDELKNLDMLKMTLLKPRQIVSGKIRAGIRVLNRFVLVSSCINVWFLTPGFFNHNQYNWDYSRSVQSFVTLHGSLWICGALCILIASFSSVMCKKTTTAVVFSYFLAFMLYLGNMYAYIVFGAMRTMSGRSPSEEILTFLSPAAAYFAIPEVRAFKDTPITYWFLYSLIYCGLGYVIYLLTVARYTSFKYHGSKN